MRWMLFWMNNSWGDVDPIKQLDNLSLYFYFKLFLFETKTASTTHRNEQQTNKQTITFFAFAIYRFPSLFVGVTFLLNPKPQILKPVFRPKLGYVWLKIEGFPLYLRFLSPRIVKTSRTKTANNERRLYSKYSLSFTVHDKWYVHHGWSHVV